MKSALLALLFLAAPAVAGPKAPDVYAATVRGNVVTYTPILGNCEGCLLGCVLSVQTAGGTFPIYFYDPSHAACVGAGAIVGSRVLVRAALSDFFCPGDFCEAGLALTGVTLQASN